MVTLALAGLLGALSPSVWAAPKAPDVKSSSVFVLDRETGDVVYSRKADEAAPIASITKLMTAIVVIDGKQPLDAKLKVTQADRDATRGSQSRLAIGTELTRGEFLRLALMSSENRAASVLGRNYPGGLPKFVKVMNAKAAELGMKRTRFVDPTGLSSQNVASARDVGKLVVAASRSATIRDYSTHQEQDVRVGRLMLQFRNTNSLVGKADWDIDLQKTGYISEAGQCLAMQADVQGRPVVFVLLNSWGKYTRVADAKRIRNWMEARKAPARQAMAGN